MPVSYSKREITMEEISQILLLEESWLMDKKGPEIKPSKFSRTVSAFANTNGGEIYLGISHEEDKSRYYWDGFKDEEAFNEYATILTEVLPTYEAFTIDAYSHPVERTWIFHITVHKTNNIIYASDKKAYVRSGVQNLPCDTTDKLLRLKLDKGLASFEDEITQSIFDDIADSSVLRDFIQAVVPQTSPYDWLRKQRVMNGDAKISVAGVLLYDECPQATLPKQSGIRIVRYLTDEKEGSRETLAEGFPISIEGDIYSIIHKAVEKVKEIVENSGVLGETGTEIKKYPDVTLHELITNAVLHRDYSILKDIQIRIFTNRIEIESPGKLPGHITLQNILNEQFSRNPKIIRLISKFPSPPNKDAGEGLNTAFRAMREMHLNFPIIEETDNSVVVTVKHERLADAESLVIDYMNSHDTISNSIARDLTGITDANKMKRVFNRLKKRSVLEIVPGTRSSATLWRKVDKEETQACDQLSLF